MGEKIQCLQLFRRSEMHLNGIIECEVDGRALSFLHASGSKQQFHQFAEGIHPNFAFFQDPEILNVGLPPEEMRHAWVICPDFDEVLALRCLLICTKATESGCFESVPAETAEHILSNCVKGFDMFADGTRAAGTRSDAEISACMDRIFGADLDSSDDEKEENDDGCANAETETKAPHKPAQRDLRARTRSECDDDEEDDADDDEDGHFILRNPDGDAGNDDSDDEDDEDDDEDGEDDEDNEEEENEDDEDDANEDEEDEEK